MSWKERIANKNAGIPSNQPQVTINQPAPPAAKGWRLKMQGTDPVPAAPRQTTIDINDSNLFPELPTASKANAPAPAKKTLTGFADLAKNWATTAKEDSEREKAERLYQDQQDYLYNYSAMNALQTHAINTQLMATSRYNYESDASE